MATVAVSSHGTLLKAGDGGGSEVFTTIAEVNDISFGGLASATEEVTSHDSGGWREYIVTLKEIGEVTFDVNFNAGATQGFAAGIYLDWINKTKRNFQLVIPTTSAKTGSFAAFVIAFPFDLPVEGVIRASITLQGTGAITWA